MPWSNAVIADHERPRKLQKQRALGVTAGLTPTDAANLAHVTHDLGYASLWSNDEPHAPGLETVAAFHRAVPTLELGVGVLPLDRNPPGQIAAAIERLAIAPERLYIGVGSGNLRPQLSAMEDAVGELRALLPKARIAVAAMRPKLCGLGGALADAVLLNWVTPERAVEARAWVEAGATSAGHAAPLLASYVRTSVGRGAAASLLAEETYYRDINEGHRRHFEGLGSEVGTVGVAGAGPDDIQAGLDAYDRAMDLPIVRLTAGSSWPDLLAVAEAARP